MSARSTPLVMLSRLPDRALRMPDSRQFDASARAIALPTSGVW
jgi:hypothetical protein